MDRFMSFLEVSKTVCLSRTEIIERRVPAGRFPKPIRLSNARNGKLVWRLSTVEKWMEDQEAKGDEPPTAPVRE